MSWFALQSSSSDGRAQYSAACLMRHRVSFFVLIDHISYSSNGPFPNGRFSWWTVDVFSVSGLFFHGPYFLNSESRQYSVMLWILSVIDAVDRVLCDVLYHVFCDAIDSSLPTGRSQSKFIIADDDDDDVMSSTIHPHGE